MKMALFGQTGSQTSQLTQVSRIFSAMRSLFVTAGRCAAPLGSAQPPCLLQFDEIEARAGLVDHLLDPILVGRGTDEQHEYALERAIFRVLERTDDRVGGIG